MTQNGKEHYKCPFPHPHPRHDQAFFEDFDVHFRIFKNREDHLSVLRLHEEIAWQTRCSESEKRRLTDHDLAKISHEAWLLAIKKATGKEIDTVAKK